ncbi:MAG: NAD(P)-dependent oxidoreductase [Gammaproteobacteria bacterium]
MSDNLNGKTLFISGGSRGIGRAIALKAAADGANVTIAAKTARPHRKLPGTIHTVAAEIEAAGGRALPIQVDIRDEEQIIAAVNQTIQEFGSLDILVNNASAINLTGTLETPMRRYDLMMDVNVRGTFACSQACLPHLLRADNPHILTLSPPLNLRPEWFAKHTAYTMSKYGMSLCTLGLAAEFGPRGVAVNSLWPRTVIATAAINMLGGLVAPADCRKPEIMADAAHVILTSTCRDYAGRFLLDEDVLRDAGVDDFEQYAVEPGHRLAPDLFLD